MGGNGIIIRAELNCCRYKQGEDGLFRLLTADTETMNATQNVMVLEASQPLYSNEDDPPTPEAGGAILSS
jgi:hypothetical protein